MTTPRQPGWYDDPQDSSAQRYWDGRGWTPHSQRKPTARPMPPPPRQPPPPPPRQPQAPAGPARPVPSPTPPPPPQARPSAGPEISGAGTEKASDGLATVKGFAVKPSIGGWILLGGLVIAIVAVFLPFATVSIRVFGMTFHAHEVSAGGTARVVVFLLAAVAVLLAWPSGSALAAWRLSGLSVVVALLTVVAVVAYRDISENNGRAEGIVKVSPAFGLLLYGAGVTVVAVGVVWLWIERSRRQK